MPKSKVSPSSVPQLPTGNHVANATGIPEQASAPKVLRYTSPFIDEALVKSVANDTLRLRTHLISQGKGDLQTGRLLLVLRGRFEGAAQAKGNVPKENVQEAFTDYIQVQFGIKESRANELIRAALKLGTFLPELLLEDSKLVEVSRLEKDDIEKMIKTYPVEKLQVLSFREVKNIVRKFNPKSRDTTKVKNKKPKNTEAETETQAPSEPSSPPKIATPLSTEAQLDGATAPVINLADFKSEDTNGFAKSFTDGVKILKDAVGDGEIPANISKLIDELYQWKNEKEAKKASGN